MSSRALKDVFTHFEAFLIGHRRSPETTVLAYTADIRQYIDFCHDRLLYTVDEPSRSTITEYLLYLRQKRLLGAQSVNRKISSLRVFYEYARDYYHVPFFIDSLVLPKKEKKLPYYANAKNIEELLLFLQKDVTLLGMRNYLIIALLYSTGMRVSELIKLSWDQIHFQEMLIVIMGKGGKQRAIPLATSLVSPLKNYHNLMQSCSTEYLFPSVYGKKIKPISRQTAWALVKDTWNAMGNDHPLWPHQLRHSLATHLLQKGMDLRSLQQLLGHESINTVQIYTHVATDRLRSVYDKKHPRSQDPRSKDPRSQTMPPKTGD